MQFQGIRQPPDGTGAGSRRKGRILELDPFRLALPMSIRDLPSSRVHTSRSGSMKRKKPNRRKTLVVNKEIQDRIVLKVSLFPMLALLVGASAIMILSTQIKAEAAEAATYLPSMGLFLFSVLGFVAVFGIILIRQAKIFSNQIAGPIYRICKSLEEVRAGNTDLRIQLREGDFNTEIADEINLLLDWMASKDQEEENPIQASNELVETTPSLNAQDPAEAPADQ